MLDKFKLIAKKWFLTFIVSIVIFIGIVFAFDGVFVLASFALMVISWLVSIPILLRHEIAAGIEKTAEVANNVAESIDNNISEETKEKIGEAMEVVADVAEVAIEVADALD